MCASKNLESLTEVNCPEQILKASSLLNESMNFSDEDVYANDNISELATEVHRETTNITTEI